MKTIPVHCIKHKDARNKIKHLLRNNIKDVEEVTANA